MKEKEYIESIHIREMFNWLDYNIHFPKDNIVSILTGPNGCGKTKILETIHALCIAPNYPVKRFNIVFSNGMELNLCKSPRRIRNKISKLSVLPIMVSPVKMISKYRGFYINELSRYLTETPQEKVEDFLNILNEDAVYEAYLNEYGQLQFKFKSFDQNIDTLQLSDGYLINALMWHRIIFCEENAPNKLLLIDMPETLQHICVQEKFMDNLIKVCEKYEMRAIVATHSPFIVGVHSDLVLDKNGPKNKRMKKS